VLLDLKLYIDGLKLSYIAGASIDITLFKPHSTRHAAATAGHVADLPVDEIPKRAGWSNATTFRRFYYKGVIE
jgi:integrase